MSAICQLEKLGLINYWSSPNCDVERWYIDEDKVGSVLHERMMNAGIHSDWNCYIDAKVENGKFTFVDTRDEDKKKDILMQVIVEIAQNTKGNG